MGAIDGKITMTTSEYRPVIVKDKKALFHKLDQCTLAIVEFEDGTISKVDLNEIKFLDDKFSGICFESD